MENVVNATDPHHPASELLPGEGDGEGEGGGEGEGAHGAHAPAAMAMTKGVEALEPWGSASGR